MVEFSDKQIEFLSDFLVNKLVAADYVLTEILSNGIPDKQLVEISSSNIKEIFEFVKRIRGY
jgi:hypothetical protein